MFSFFGRKDRKLSSGTAEHPAPQDVFRAMVLRIVEEEWEYATFEADTGDGWAQVSADKPGGFVVNFKYPFVGDVRTILDRHGMAIPPECEVVYEDPNLAATVAFSTLEGYLGVTFLDDVFIKLLGYPRDYVVTGSLE